MNKLQELLKHDCGDRVYENMTYTTRADYNNNEIESNDENRGIIICDNCSREWEYIDQGNTRLIGGKEYILEKANEEDSEVLGQGSLKELIEGGTTSLNKDDIELLKLYENKIIGLLSKWFQSTIEFQENYTFDQVVDAKEVGKIKDEDLIKIHEMLQILFESENKNFDKLFNEFSNEIDEIEDFNPTFDYDAIIFHLKDAIQNLIFCSDLDEALKAIIRWDLASDSDIMEVLVEEAKRTKIKEDVSS